MARIFFGESGCLRTREAGTLYIIMAAALVVVVPLGMFAFMLGLAFI